MRVKESQPQCFDRRIDMPTRSETGGPGRAVAWAATGAVQRFLPERWVIDLLALALAGLLVGAAALYALAVVSTWVPTPNPPTPSCLMRGDHEAGAATFGAGIQPDTDLDIDAMAVARLLDVARHGLVHPERYVRNAPRGPFGA